MLAPNQATTDQQPQPSSGQVEDEEAARVGSLTERTRQELQGNENGNVVPDDPDDGNGCTEKARDRC